MYSNKKRKTIGLLRNPKRPSSIASHSEHIDTLKVLQIYSRVTQRGKYWEIYFEDFGAVFPRVLLKALQPMNAFYQICVYLHPEAYMDGSYEPMCLVIRNDVIEGIKEIQFQDTPSIMDLRRVTSSDDLRHGPSLRGVHIDETDGSESQASTLMSELRCSRKKKREESLPHRTVEVSDISLMDDFEEMKLMMN
ncbi:hypothetical protein Syun_004870 [Stephania yunnanensis]|uniref:Uncharacterized protein n=1 Tax=Stephania yunnanensis TaxID=152371 RepID=A0AAP0L591_9MAGN